ncbi:MAG: AzlD domain-containing protein [Pseudomonadota bacterium]
MSFTAAEIWAIIVILGIGTFLIRFSFLGLIGDRALPPFALKLLRYTPVAVIPGLVAPLVIWPEATGGAPDLARLIAAAVTLAAGVKTRSFMVAIVAGAVTFYLLSALL